ncbi:unnamed protein product [Effrenium voratum]|uniref:Uncharacterized protein n=1 Tax=Effrenium voratum TaxID=2562239 RepID=A0AA36IFF7_9DINO|nr:unnamed protein product [Effrenium voratum]CAJ1427623.1 unnamed protein product [Effrenium voratum]
MAGAAEQRFLCLMILARSLSAAGLGLLVSASADLLYQLMRQRSSAQVHQRVQRALTNVATLSTLLDFFLAPAMGRYMDTVGRLATMMLALGCSAGVRLWLAAAPSLPVYLFYRVLVSVTGTAWFGASAAAMSDVFGRGTPGFAEASSRVRRFALVAMMAGTYSGRMIKAPRHAFAIVGLVQLLALSTVGCMKETLKAPAARPQGSFWSFFRQSQALLGFAVLNTAMELPGHVGNLSQVLRRQRFRHWTTAAESTHVLLLQVAAVVSTYLRPRVLELGFASAARLDCWCGALISLNSALAPAAVFLALNPVLACLQCGDLAVELCMEREAAALNLGTGALKAASANRGFVPALVMPRLYGALYSWRPEAPFLVASALSLLAAEVVGPWAFGKKGEKNRAPNAAGVFCGRFVGAASCAGGPLF